MRRAKNRKGSGRKEAQLKTETDKIEQCGCRPGMEEKAKERFGEKREDFMIERIDYFIKSGNIVIYRCYGEGSVLELPGEIEGLPVTELADHCFAPEASLRYPHQELYRACRRQRMIRSQEEDAESWQRVINEPEQEEKLQVYPALAGEKISEILLPQGVEVIGDYGFYGCRSLKRLVIPGSLKRLGGGAFVACNHIQEICFFTKEETIPECVKDVVAELSYEIEMSVENEKGELLVRLTYPEYYEESIENTPARIIEIAYHGMGYKYRQCFQNRKIDFRQYDSLFALATVQEFVPTLLKLSLNRLCAPMELTEENRKRYLQWLQKEHKSVARKLMEEDEMNLLRLLGSQEYFTKEILEVFLEAASRAGRPEAVSYLMEYRHKYFPPEKKKKYEF